MRFTRPGRETRPQRAASRNEAVEGPDASKIWVSDSLLILCPIDLVQAELLGLHEGNIARFRLRPSVFEAWRMK